MSVLSFAILLSLTQPAQPKGQDFDQDGVEDFFDDCPTDPGRPEFSGCPGLEQPRPAAPSPSVAAKVVVEKDTVEVKDSIQFRLGSASVAEESWPLLAALADKVKTLPAKKKILIEGHTDDLGPKPANVALSQRRAEAIIAHLVRAGVDRTRLEAIGLGPDRPLVPNDSDASRAKNRRVEFHIVDVP